jgi:hypothetical protein
VFWQQLDAANWMLPMMSLPCHLLCFGNNRMLPMHMSLLWQQPNAANDVLSAPVLCVGCVLAATECGQNDVLSVIAAQKWAVFWQQPNAAKTMCYQLLPRRSGLCFASN